VRQLYYCPECKGYFSETHSTPLANLKTPLSRIIEILQALTPVDRAKLGIAIRMRRPLQALA
jgi:hypothetical protein